jgi:tRNA A37 threonylcarbamoyladenosine dehydratase
MIDFSWLQRTAILVGDNNLLALSKKHVMIVGMGGVGSFAAEFIVRSGIGNVTIVDGDVVDPTNRNRQLPALATNHGISKVQIMAERLLAINPELKLQVVKKFITPEAVSELLQSKPDFIIDAIDSITPKLTLLTQAFALKIKIVSSMGAGAKLDPTKLKVVDISKTYNCPFAQQIRKSLRKFGIYKGITTVFSPEEPIRSSLMLTDGKNFKKSAYGTISYLPATFGAVTASVVIRHFLSEQRN